MKSIISTVIVTVALLACFSSSRSENLADQARKSIVYIYYKAIDPATGAAQTFQGTGFVVASNGYVLTASHVFRAWVKQSAVDKANNPIMATLRDKPGMVTQSPLVLNPVNLGNPDAEDVALLKFPEGDYPVVPICFAKAEVERAGNQLWAYGFPLNRSFQPVPATLGNKDAPGARWAASSAFTEGMSGGPVYSADGIVIGLVKGGLDSDAVKWITPIRHADNYLRTAGFPSSAYQPRYLLKG